MLLFMLACAIVLAVATNRSSVAVKQSHKSPVSSLMASGSAKIGGLLLTTSRKRQAETCESEPGGPFCSATTCCRPGEICCTKVDGCCSNTEQCVGTVQATAGCCPKDDTICPGEAGCCPKGNACCGDKCCLAGNICERNECINGQLKNNIVRFELDTEKNRQLLENMCEGIRLNNGGETKNTEVLTYRGKEKGGESRAPIRKAAGCVRGYCSKPENNGGDPANNSCDEYPPASTLEGGNARPAGQRIIVCLPQAQNSRQGQKFSDMLRQYKVANDGQELLKKEAFVISIPCDELEQTRRREFFSYPEMVARDAVSSFGNGSVDPDMRLTNNASEFVLLAMGDLASGTYTMNVQLTAGATSGGYILDNEGDEIFASSTSVLTTGQSQQYIFTLDDDRFGLGLALITDRNDTKATFNLTGTTTDPSTSITALSIPTPSNTAANPFASGTGTNPAISRGSSQTIPTLLVGMACAMILCILNSVRMTGL